MVENEDRNIRLFPADDETSGFRTRNSPASSSRLSGSFRSLLLNRGHEEPSVRVSLYKVRHGTLANGRPGSLIVTDFHFRSTGRRRMVSAAINYTFRTKENPRLAVDDKRAAQGIDKDKPAPPAVRDITPIGYASIQRTEKEVELKASLDSSAGGPVDAVAGASLSKAKTWVVESGKVTADKSTVAGTMRSRYREDGEKDTARWMLTENESQKSGIPNYLRTAILVEREDDNSDFLATIEVSVTLDEFSQLRRVFGGMSINEAVIFQPRRVSNRKSGEMNVESYGAKNLDENDWKEAVSLIMDAGLGAESGSFR